MKTITGNTYPVKEQIKQIISYDESVTAARNKSLDNNHNCFYASLKEGDIIHYGAVHYVRCKVVIRDGKTLLLPIALVGNWPMHDLPKRYMNGRIDLSYYPKMINDGVTFTPNSSQIYEAKNDPNSNDPDSIDPRMLDPISLEIPEMSAEEETEARRRKES